MTPKKTDQQTTPGPWRVVQNRANLAYTEIGNGDYGCIASTNHMRPSVEENEANAELIAAAPQLLRLVRQYAIADSLSDITNATNDARPVLDRLCPGWDQPAE